MQDAKITTEAGRQWWLCPNCRKRLAEIVGARIVIDAGVRHITLSVNTEPDQVCPKCGTVSTVTQKAIAA